MILIVCRLSRSKFFKGKRSFVYQQYTYTSTGKTVVDQSAMIKQITDAGVLGHKGVWQLPVIQHNASGNPEQDGPNVPIQVPLVRFFHKGDKTVLYDITLKISHQSRFEYQHFD